jgi:hypothetical protein
MTSGPGATPNPHTSKGYTDVVRQVDTPEIVKFFVIVVSFVTEEH